jgi:hypothetical protein
MALIPKTRPDAGFYYRPDKRIELTAFPFTGLSSIIGTVLKRRKLNCILAQSFKVLHKILGSFS